MPRRGFDEASKVDPLWSLVPSSLLKAEYSLDHLCLSLRATPDTEHSLIEKLITRKEGGVAQHEFLLILLHRPSGGTFWMRLDRKGPEGDLVRLVSRSSEANDRVSALIDN